jgi:hypothetical protein
MGFLFAPGEQASRRYCCNEQEVKFDEMDKESVAVSVSAERRAHWCDIIACAQQALYLAVRFAARP